MLAVVAANVPQLSVYSAVILSTRAPRVLFLPLFSQSCRAVFCSALPIRIDAACLPTSFPFCSTVVSIGSQAMARCPLVNPHTEMSSGMRSPMCFAVYIMPMAVSSLTAKKASGLSSMLSTSGVILSACSRLSQNLFTQLSGSMPCLRSASCHPLYLSSISRGSCSSRSSYMPASGLDEIFHGRERSHVVVHHHAARVHARADAVEEHKRHVLVYQVGKVVVL